MLSCSIVGATSFTGSELIRVLARHPHVKIGSLTTRSEEKIYAREMVPSLGKANDLVIEKFNFHKVAKNSDVVFVTLPHTFAMKIAGDFYDEDKIVIDLSADFRLHRADIYEEWYQERHTRKDLLKHAVYGLPEIYRDRIKQSNLIANPGCYPTSATLGLLPLLGNDLIKRLPHLSNIIRCDLSEHRLSGYQRLRSRSDYLYVKSRCVFFTITEVFERKVLMNLEKVHAKSASHFLNVTISDRRVLPGGHALG